MTAASREFGIHAALTGRIPIPGTQFTIRPAPVREPPFEDELPSRHLTVVGPHDRPLPFTTAPSSTDVRIPLADHARDDPGSRRTVAHPDGDPVQIGRRLVIAIIEIATGRRAAGTVAQLTAPSVLAGLTRDAGRIHRLGSRARPATLHSMHSGSPADGVAELAAVVCVDGRYRAIALRMEHQGRRWRCVRLQIG